MRYATRTAALALAGAMLLLSTAAQALRCEGRLVEPGDHAVQVVQVCGEPFWVDQHSEWLISGEGGPLEQRVERVVEVWYYNFGADRLMQRLVFRDDRMQSEESLGYGFDRPARDCNPDRLPMGISNGEIIARCGAPLSRREQYADQVERDGRGLAQVRVQRREHWVYGRGSGSSQRVLLLVDGRLTQTQRLRR